ncbi:MAG TPA: hypothetical protein VLC09_13030 [Polyangiaceae bacterium]|nr:hypothetical protein [Polyangiaceae bacterium]
MAWGDSARKRPRAPQYPKAPLWLLLAGLAVAGGSACQGELNGGVDCRSTPGEQFERRITPLLEADHPNTCAQCHTGGGVDLASFLRPDACESMACLKAQGLVDLEHPERSVLLSWIDRASPQPAGGTPSPHEPAAAGGAGGQTGGSEMRGDAGGGVSNGGASPQPASPLITQAILDQERLGFLQWIEHEAACGSCADVACPDAAEARCEADATLPAALDASNDPGDCEQATLERLFRGTIYEWRGRCYPCHFEGTTGNADAPRWATDLGNCQVASLATMQNVLASHYVDLAVPTRSLILLKPLAVSDGGVEHGGHDKFTRDDPAYEAYVLWLTRYAECSRK